MQGLTQNPKEGLHYSCSVLCSSQAHCYNKCMRHWSLQCEEIRKGLLRSWGSYKMVGGIGH